MRIITHRQFEGIDTISLKLFGDHVNPGKFLYAVGYEPKSKVVNRGVTVRTQKSDYSRFYGCNYYCDIQVEDTLVDQRHYGTEDIHLLIKIVISNLLEKGFLIPDNEHSSDPDCKLRRYAKVSALDFYFDFLKKDAILSDFRRQYETTRYSPDHKKGTSLICAYDKNQEYKDHYREKIKKEYIRTDAPMRIEIRLRSSNGCPYLHIDNLKGNYQEVFWCYRGHLAKIWRKYGKTVIKEVRCDIKHQNFQLLKFLAESGEKIPLSADLINIHKNAKNPLNILSKKNNDKSSETITADDEDDAYLYKLFGMTSSDDSDKNKQSE